jgi:murein DD-endopeptidase MepM/ murein hydrolase activator NlpD
MRFDQSLEQLERSRVITPQERRVLKAGQPQSPIDVSRHQRACRDGALSRQECAAGVAVRSLPRSRRAPASSRTPKAVPVDPLLAGGESSFSVDSFFAVTPRPSPRPGNGDTRLLFPVIGQAVTTSGFGWRLHPILGDWMMHAGKDFAAPNGTPVVAALSGRVVSSGLAGGYGIAVELEHSAPKRRTLYGHLSELYVRAGQTVRQGDVIGRVGSTGRSTGPHLHFELRLPKNGSWQAVNPAEFDLGPSAERPADPVAELMAALLRSLQRA